MFRNPEKNDFKAGEKELDLCASILYNSFMCKKYSGKDRSKEVMNMTVVNVNINTIEKVKSFVNVLVKFDCDFDLVSGRYVVDAKSIMGIFSMDLAKPIQLNIHVDNDEAGEILAALDPYIIK